MEVVNVLEQLIELLRTCGEQEVADWLQQRSVELGGGATSARQRDILLELKGIIAGMGSLTDIYLIPPDEGQMSEEEANRKRWDLTMALDREVRTGLGL